MKKSILILFACAMFCISTCAQQVNQDLIPASTGLNLGHSNQRWNGFLQNLNISGTCFVNGMACFGNGIQHTTFASIPPEIDGTLIYCTDCQQTNPCVGGGTGAFGEGVNGVWSCSAGGGLKDPGSNGPITRTALNTTAPAASADIIGLFTACSGTQYLGADGACHTSSGAPLQALPASPLINQGASTPPVYAGGVTYHTTAQNWSQSQTASLTAGALSTLTLTPCPLGVDTTTGYGYQVYLNDGASSETVNVTSGTCTSGGATGTIVFTPFFNHGPGAYTVGSASSGIQETLNTSCGTALNFSYQYGFCNVTIPSSGSLLNTAGNPFSLTTYDVQGTIYLHSNQTVVNGYGASLLCTGRGACIQAGDRISASDFGNITIQGLTFRTPTNYSTNSAYAGVQITNAVRTTNVATITTATNHNFRPGDMVTILFTDDDRYWGDAIVTTVPTPTTFTYSHTGADILTAATPGVVALAYVAVLDNASNTHLKDISYDPVGEAGHFNNFFDFWDDESALVEHFSNNAINLNANANWSGSFIFSGGNNNLPTAGQHAAVISVRDSNFTANLSSCATAYNSNGLYLDNSVCQATGLWQLYAANTTGNFQGAEIRNLYTEGAISGNPFGSITGSVTSGIFQTGEQWIQAVTGATVYALNAPTGVQSASVTSVVGIPDNSHTWTGQTSLAVYTPTAVPTGYKTPFPGTGIAGLIAGPVSAAGTFSVTGNATGLSGAYQTGGAGATKYTYWVIANDTTTGKSTSPMRVLDWSSTGTDLIPVQWPRISNRGDTITYDVIRQTTPPSGGTFPYTGGCGGGSGGTCGSVATALSQATACGGTLVCSFQDVGSSTTSSYAIATGTYPGNLLFWPGAIVSVASTVSVDTEQTPVTAVGLNNNAIQSAKRCGGGVASSGGHTACFSAPTSASQSIGTGMLLTDFGASGAQTPKGRLNISQSNLYQHEIITLVDATPAKTRATYGFRPTWDANDTWIGIDAPNNGSTSMSTAQLAFGAPTAISNYVGALPNAGATNFLERLSATLKSFTVPINTTSYLDMVEMASPGNPAANTCRRYVDSTTHLITYLNSAGASCAGGAVTGTGVANQAAVWSAGTALTGFTDFLYTAGTPNKLTIPGGGATTQIIGSGTNNSGFSIGTGGMNLFSNNNVATGVTFGMYSWNGSSYIAASQILGTYNTGTIFTPVPANSILGLRGTLSSTGNASVIALGSSATLAATSGTQSILYSGTSTVAGSLVAANFAPTSGTADLRHLFLNPIVNQTGGANGTVRIAAFYPVNTAVGGTEYLIAAGTAATQAVGAVLTDKFTVDNSGNVVSQGSVTATTSVKGATYLTATNCAANGTAANPSVASCTAASAGAFSCDVAASGGTCTVNTTSVTANSEIFVQEVASEGARLTVTCNTSPTVIPAITLASKVAGTSFTINMPTITTNPACFIYNIVN